MKNKMGNFHVSRGQSRSQITSPIQSKMETMNPMRATRAILLSVALLMTLGASLHAQAIRYESVAQTTNSACAPGSLCPILAVPGAIIAVYSNAALTTPAVTYTDATGSTPCPTYAQITLPGSFSCSSTSDSSGNIGVWVGQGTFYYTLRFPDGTHGPFSFTAGVAGVIVAGSDMQVQYNRMGQFGADSGLTWNYTSQSLSIVSSMGNDSQLFLEQTTPANVMGVVLNNNGSNKWNWGMFGSGASYGFFLQDLTAAKTVISIPNGASQNIIFSPTSGSVYFNGNPGTPSIVSANNAFIQSTGGFLSVANSWQGINSAVDGALLRGYGVAANNTNTAGGYFDIAPITYNPYLGGTCLDVDGNPVQQPLPLPGLSSFGANDAILWVGTSPLMPSSGSCGVPLPSSPDIGLNTNSYIFAIGGLASSNLKYNAINTIYAGSGHPAGGVEAGTLIAGTLYPTGTVTTTGTLGSPAYLGGYIQIGKSIGPPAVGTIATVTNPLVNGDGIEAGTMYYDSSNDCVEVAANSLTFACIGGGGSGSGTVSSSAQYNIPYYTTNPTGTVVGGSTIFTFNPTGTPQVSLAGNFQTNGAAFGFDASTCTATNCLQAPMGGVTGKSLITTDSAFWIEEAAPGLSVSGQCRTYDDSASHTLLLSCNGGAYANISGTGSGTVSSGSQFQIAYYAANGTVVSGNAALLFNPATPQISFAGTYQTNGTTFGFNASTCTNTNCIQASVGGLEGKWSTVTDSNFWVEEAAPVVSSPGQCRLYDDSAVHNLLLSCNGGAYAALGGGGGSGTVNPGSATQVGIYATSGSVISGNVNFVFNPVTNILGVSGSYQANGTSGGYNAPIAAAYNAFQAPAGGMAALSFTARNYIQTGNASSTPALSSGDSFNPGAMYYNTVAACEELYNGFSFTCLGGSGGGVSSLNTLTGTLTLAGTTNQITVTPAGGTITLAFPSTIATGGYNATNTGTGITFQNSSGNYQVNGNGVMSLAGSITTQGGLNVTTTNAATSIQTLGGADLCNAGSCASGIAMQVDGFSVYTVSGGVINSIVNGTFNSTGSGITFQNSSGNFQVSSAGAVSLAGVLTSAGGVNVTTTTSGSAIQAVGGANLCNAGTCSSGNALTIDGTPVITVSGGVASMTLAGTGTFSSAVTFNGGFTQNLSTNSTVRIGTGALYIHPIAGASSAVSCSGIQDGYMATTTDDYVVVCLGGGRFRAALSSY